MMFGEMMSGVFADEILQPGEGQVRAVIVHGSNVINVMPDQMKTSRALQSLDECERAARQGAQISIASVPAQGATVSIILPPVR